MSKMRQPRAKITQEERDQFAQYVPLLVASDVVTDWERTFCISIAGRLKRGAWWPTEKQAPILRRLVDKFKQKMAEDFADADVIEEFDTPIGSDA